MSWRKIWIFLSFLTLPLGVFQGVTGTAWARNDQVRGSRYTAARMAAMGDASLPMADDPASALFYNPAGLAKIKNFTLEPLNLGIQSNTHLIDIASLKVYKAASLSSFKDELARKPDLTPGLSAAFLPAFGFKGFAAGLLVQGSTLASAEPNNQIRYRSSYELVPAAGIGFKLADGVVKIGYSLQWVNKAEGDITVDDTDPNLGYRNYLKEGSGLSHNMGLALTLPFTYLPQFNVVARNIGGLQFGSSSLYGMSSNTRGIPEDEKMSVDASASMAPKTGSGTFMTFVFEYRDMFNVSQVPVLTRLATGLEWSFRDRFFIRAGYGSGYPAAGIGLRSKKADLSIAWFSEELKKAFHGERDTRYMLQLQIRAF